MKKGILFLLAAALCLAVLLPVSGETASVDDSMEKDQVYARWAIAVAAQLTGNAGDRLDEGSDTLGTYYNMLSRVDFLRPMKVILIRLTDGQTAAAQEALQVSDAVGIAPALAEYLNRQFSQGYTDAVNSVLPDAIPGAEDGNVLVLLPYERDVAVVSFANRTVRGAYIVSTPENSAALDAEVIGEYAGQIGVTGLDCRVYEGDSKDLLLSLIEWQGTYYDAAGVLTDAVTKSENRMRRMFRMTLDAGVLDDSFLYYLMKSYLEDSMVNDLTGAARLISEFCLPAMSEKNPDAAARFMSESKVLIDILRDQRRPPEIEYAEAVMPDPEGTYMYVIELHHPERGEESFYDPVLEASLPAKNIPQTPEDADYIIRCRVTYSDTPDLSNETSAVFCPTTEITVHEAGTGALVCSLGSVTRPKPQGVVMVSRGNTYYSPYLDQIWEKTRVLFEEE